MSNGPGIGRDPLVFDSDPYLYEKARPGYPPRMYRWIVKRAGIRRGSNLLEIGCGTGKSTEWFAEHGFGITAVEKGRNLAEFAMSRFSLFPNVRVVNAAFEQFEAGSGAFDVVYSGTAFHWIDQSVAYRRASEILKAAGFIALFWSDHMITDKTAGQFEEVERAYRTSVPEWYESFRKNGPGDDNQRRLASLASSGFFGPVECRKFYFDITYSASQYTDLLRTYSDHAALPEETRFRLFSDIERTIKERLNGKLTKEYRISLFLAQKLV